MNERNYILFVLKNIFLVILSLVLIYLFVPKKKDKYIVISHKRDTVYVVKKFKPDTIIKKQIKVIYRDKVVINKTDSVAAKTDTVLSFIATDTLVTRRDTINVSFYYPELMFKYIIKSGPDTLKYINQTIVKQEQPKKDVWGKIEYGVIGVAIGIIIKSIIK